MVVVVALGGQGRACDRGNGNRQDERIPSRAALGRWRVRALQRSGNNNKSETREESEDRSDSERELD